MIKKIWIDLLKISGATFLILGSFSRSSIADCPHGYFPYSHQTLKGSSVELVDVSKGRFIYGQFSDHILDQRRDFVAIANRRNDTLEQKVKDWRTLLEDNKDLVDSKRESEAAILALLKAKKIQWIGIEQSKSERKGQFEIDPITAPDGVKEYQETKQYLDSFRGLKNNEKDRLLILLYPPYIRALAEDESLKGSFKVYALEDDKAKAAGFGLAATFEARRKELKNLNSESVRTKIESIFSEATKEGTPMAQDEIDQVIAELPADPSGGRGSGAPPALTQRQIAKAYFDAAKAFMENASLRNKKVADTALKLKGSGYIEMGTAHGPELMNILKESCTTRTTTETEGARGG